MPRVGCDLVGSNKDNEEEMGAVTKWSKALLLREKIDENQEIPGSTARLGQFLKKKKNKNKRHQTTRIETTTSRAERSSSLYHKLYPGLR